jgi:hypothetical protein
MGRGAVVEHVVDQYLFSGGKYCTTWELDVPGGDPPENNVVVGHSRIVSSRQPPRYFSDATPAADAISAFAASAPLALTSIGATMRAGLAEAVAAATARELEE